jgi:hypothetical protein
MPNPYFLVLEMVILVLFGLALRHAWGKGLPVVWQLLAGVIYGLLLEWATIQQLRAYEYGNFLLMLSEVPVMVGVAWGTIIYSVRLFSESTSLPEGMRPIMDGLLALNIDMSMDAIAIRLGMWDWGRGLQAEYFGVPYANFWAWFWVVFSFSFGLRVLSRGSDEWRQWLAPPVAILTGMLGVLGSNALIIDLADTGWYQSTIFLVLGSALLLMMWLRPKFHTKPVDRLVFWVPLGFHAYFLAAGSISGVILQPPFLLLVSVVMAGVALYLHRGSWKDNPSEYAHYVRDVKRESLKRDA